MFDRQYFQEKDKEALRKDLDKGVPTLILLLPEIIIVATVIFSFCFG